MEPYHAYIHKYYQFVVYFYDITVMVAVTNVSRETGAKTQVTNCEKHIYVLTLRNLDSN